MLKTISFILLILTIICVFTLVQSDLKKMVRNLIYSNKDYLNIILPSVNI